MLENEELNISIEGPLKYTNRKAYLSMRKPYESSGSPTRAYEDEILTKMTNMNPLAKNIKMMSIKKILGGAAHKRVPRVSGIKD
jgi:hypothetical protein